MASKKRALRLNKLSADDRRNLLTTLGINPESFQETGGVDFTNPYIRQFEESGVLPEQVQNQELLQRVSEIPKSRADLLRTYTGDTDEFALTDDELRNRLSAFEELSGEGQVDVESLVRDLSAKFHPYKIPDTIQKIVDEIVTTGNLPSDISVENLKIPDLRGLYPLVPHEPLTPVEGYEDVGKDLGKDILNKFPEVAKGEIEKVFKDFKSGKYTRKGINTSPDVSRISDQLALRDFNTAKERDVEDFLTQLPKDLESAREEFLQGEQGRAVEQFQDEVPGVLSGLNKRGLLFSGDVEDVLSSRAVDLQGALEQQRAQLEAEDLKFYYDAAYRSQLKKSLTASEDYRTEIQGKRQNVLGERQKSFESSQSDLNRVLNEQLTREDYQRKLELRKQELETARRNKSDETLSEVLGTIIGSGVQIAGSKLGSKTAPTPRTI